MPNSGRKRAATRVSAFLDITVPKIVPDQSAAIVAPNSGTCPIWRGTVKIVFIHYAKLCQTGPFGYEKPESPHIKNYSKGPVPNEHAPVLERGNPVSFSTDLKPHFYDRGRWLIICARPIGCELVVFKKMHVVSVVYQKRNSHCVPHFYKRTPAFGLLKKSYSLESPLNVFFFELFQVSFWLPGLAPKFSPLLFSLIWSSAC